MISEIIVIPLAESIDTIHTNNMVLDLSIKTVAGFWQRDHHILEIWLTETLSKQLKEKILYLRIRSDKIRM